MHAGGRAAVLGVQVGHMLVVKRCYICVNPFHTSPRACKVPTHNQQHTTTCSHAVSHAAMQPCSHAAMQAAMQSAMQPCIQPCKFHLGFTECRTSTPKLHVPHKHVAQARVGVQGFTNFEPKNWNPKPKLWTMNVGPLNSELHGLNSTPKP